MQSRVLTLLAAALVLGAAPAAAQVGLEVGGFGSFTKFDRTIAPDDQIGGGARASILYRNAVGAVALEGEWVYTKFTGTSYDLKHVPLRGRLTYRVPLAPGASFIFGGGVVRNHYMATGIDTTDWGATALLGRSRSRDLRHPAILINVVESPLWRSLRRARSRSWASCAS